MTNTDLVTPTFHVATRTFDEVLLDICLSAVEAAGPQNPSLGKWFTAMPATKRSHLSSFKMERRRYNDEGEETEGSDHLA